MKRMTDAQRAAALEPERQGALLRLLHIAHHGGRRQHAPQGRRGRGQRLMDLPRALHDLARLLLGGLQLAPAALVDVPQLFFGGLGGAHGIRPRLLGGGKLLTSA